MKLILHLDQRPDGCLAGSVMLPGDPELRPFWGVMELVARIEELREIAAEWPAPSSDSACSSGWTKPSAPMVDQPPDQANGSSQFHQNSQRVTGA